MSGKCKWGAGVLARKKKGPGIRSPLHFLAFPPAHYLHSHLYAV